MKKIIFALCLTAAAVFAGEGTDKPLKVLMIGNSFSICVLQQTPAIANNLGCKLDVVSLYIGGCPLSKHANNLSSTNGAYGCTWNYCGEKGTNAVPFYNVLKIRKDKGGNDRRFADIRPMLSADKWDVVTIQQASHESWNWDKFQPHADKLIAAIRELAPQAEIRIQQTWSYCKADGRICNKQTGGAGSWGFDRSGMYERLTANYTRLSKDAGGLKIIPTGCAVELYRKEANIDTAKDDVVGNGGDSIHLNGNGHYLQGLVWTRALFGVDVTKCTYKPAWMSEEKAVLLRKCAAEANLVEAK